MIKRELGASLMTGIDIIDEQHQGLLDLLNGLHCHTEEDLAERREEFEALLDKLINYINVHFSTEEAMMREAGIVDNGPHLEEHRKFTEEVGGFAKDFYTMDLLEFQEVKEFLVKWYENHIMITDMKYVEKVRGSL